MPASDAWHRSGPWWSPTSSVSSPIFQGRWPQFSRASSSTHYFIKLSSTKYRSLILLVILFLRLLLLILTLSLVFVLPLILCAGSVFQLSYRSLGPLGTPRRCSAPSLRPPPGPRPR